MASKDTRRAGVVENVGSAVRDYCMLERNLLSHFRLAMLLALLSASVLLRTRLIPEPGNDPQRDHSRAGVLMGTVQYIASLGAIVAGCWDFTSDLQKLMHNKAFLVNDRHHLAIMTVVAGVIFSTSIILLSEEDKL